METTKTITRDKVARYVIVREGSGRIVATIPGTHHMLETFCERLDTRLGGRHFYDDATAASDYLPQIGPNVDVTNRPWK